ncbi:hypothetical protein GCM10028808_49960 [Spirosoma migulaei]
MANNLRYKSGDVVGMRNTGTGLEVLTWRIRYLPTLELLILTVQSSLLDAWEGRERIQSKTDIGVYTLDPDFLNSEYVQFLADNAALNAKGLNQSDYLYNKYVEQTAGTDIPLEALKPKVTPPANNPPNTPPATKPPVTTPPTSNNPLPGNTPTGGNLFGIPTNYLIIGVCAFVILFVLANTKKG